MKYTKRSIEGEKRRLQAIPKGKKHWNWNDNPSFLTLHRRIHRRYGKAKWHLCVDCGKQAFDWSNETGEYTDKIEDYVPRCRKCHLKKDFTEERRNKAKNNYKKRGIDTKGRFIKN